VVLRAYGVATLRTHLPSIAAGGGAPAIATPARAAPAASSWVMYARAWESSVGLAVCPRLVTAEMRVSARLHVSRVFSTPTALPSAAKTSSEQRIGGLSGRKSEQ
jgi:hypothetical protein